MEPWESINQKRGAMSVPPLEPSKLPAGALLGRSWAALGRRWGRLGALLDPSWGSLGYPSPILQPPPSWLLPPVSCKMPAPCPMPPDPCPLIPAPSPPLLCPPRPTSLLPLASCLLRVPPCCLLPPISCLFTRTSFLLAPPSPFLPPFLFLSINFFLSSLPASSCGGGRRGVVHASLRRLANTYIPRPGRSGPPTNTVQTSWSRIATVRWVFEDPQVGQP